MQGLPKSMKIQKDMKEYSFGLALDCLGLLLHVTVGLRAHMTTPSESPKWHGLSDWNCYAQFTV